LAVLQECLRLVFTFGDFGLVLEYHYVIGAVRITVKVVS